MKKCVVIADYGGDSLVLQELRSSIEGFLKSSNGVNITFVESVPSTVHTGYLLAQVVQTEERYGIPHETVFFVNTDPRIEDTTAVKHAEGAKGVIIKLATGVTIIGPNAGHCFSLVRDKIQAIYQYEGLEKGSQFRSRDLYPKVVAHLMDYMEEDLELEDLSKKVIPELRDHHVGHIDNYGNIKTTITHEDMKGKLEYGDMIEISIAGTKQKAKYVDNLFGGNVGELVLYPGSSGDPKNQFLEISAWSHFGDTKDGSAARTGKDFFKEAMPGMAIELT